MRFPFVRCVSVLAAMLLVLVPATAQVVVVNNGPVTIANAADITTFATADDFTLSATATFNAIRFWALDTAGDPALLDQFSGTLSWFIHNNGAGIPDPAILASGTVSGGIMLTDTGVNLLFTNQRIFQLDFSVPDTTLPAGTYWLRLKENTPTDPSDASFVYWVWRGGQSGNTLRISGDEVNPANWSNGIADLAYQLRFNAAPAAAIPEPGTLALLLVGGVMTGAGVLRRRRG